MKFGISLFFEGLSINFKLNLNLTRMTALKAHILYSVVFFRKILPFVRLCGRAEQATNDNTAHVHFLLDT